VSLRKGSEHSRHGHPRYLSPPGHFDGYFNPGLVFDARIFQSDILSASLDHLRKRFSLPSAVDGGRGIVLVPESAHYLGFTSLNKGPDFAAFRTERVSGIECFKTLRERNIYIARLDYQLI
jgi:hypothetical protein